VEGISDGDSISVFYDTDWKGIVLMVVGTAQNADVIVLAATHRLTMSLSLEQGFGGIGIGQDMYFLGYPFGLFHDLARFHDGRPIPLVKKGILSGLDSDKFYLDGHNNPGFSGGPVVYNDLDTKELKLAGLVSAYRIDEELIYHQGQQVPSVTRANTGIVIAYGIEYALRLIRANPIGFALPLTSP